MAIGTGYVSEFEAAGVMRLANLKTTPVSDLLLIAIGWDCAYLKEHDRSLKPCLKLPHQEVDISSR